MTFMLPSSVLRTARPARLLLTGVLACTATALAGCGSSRGAAEVEVQDAGSGETVAFRVDVAEGDVERQELQLTQRVDAGLGEAIEVPSITFVLVSEVTSVSEDEIVLEQTYEDATVAEGEGSTQIQSALQPLVGASGTVTISPTGGVLESDFEVPAGLDPTAEQTFEALEDQASALGVTFPEEEIGEGATWSAESSVEANGITVEQVATYTLDSLDGEEYSISVDVQQEIQEGEVDGVEIEGGTGTTTGTFEGTVGTISPVTATSSGTTTVRAQGQSVTTELDSEITTTYE